ncbi:erythromycin esterase family protein [Nakamurella deserti]|uniref:erythromycin esterase family protein n=1 Tax=Nakamurella deserti TaxID=2164074 RepID=UPI000DBE05EF|nr:erythromycin esterase family protein [Nakamurella deserti]
MTDPHLPVHPLDAAAALTLFPAPPRVLALGEPTHGSEVLLELRNDLFRDLVATADYRTIALETDCLNGLLVDDHVTTGAGDLDDVMARGFSHGWGASPANRELVRWLREVNRDRPADDLVRFAGFDGPLEMAAASSPRCALEPLHRFLAHHLGDDRMPCPVELLGELVGPDDRWTDPAAMYDPARSIGGSTDVARLRVIADDLVALLEAERPGLRSTSSGREVERAELRARSAVGLLRYHAAMATPAGDRLQRLCALRDAMMAAELLALAARGPVFVHAHNSHLQRTASTMSMGGPPFSWWGAGAVVASHLGTDYGHLAGAVGTVRAHGVDVPAPDTLEGLLHAVPTGRFLIDARSLSDATAGPPARVSPWFGYAPLDPAQLDTVDGVVFARDA